MQDLLNYLINFIPTSTYFEISFGLIISIVLFYIDSRGKNRQEETLRRQDESLDIILEQVSKVNVFQTKTLNLAIESLGTDLQAFKNELEELKILMNSEKSFMAPIREFGNEELPSDFVHTSSSHEQAIPDTPSVPNPPQEPVPPKPHELMTSKFSELFAGQLNSFVENIKESIENIEIAGDKKVKDIYKMKKGLEFDLKDLVTKQSMLEEMQRKHIKQAKRNHQKILEKEKAVDQKAKAREREHEIQDKIERIDKKFDEFEDFRDVISFANKFVKSLDGIEGANIKFDLSDILGDKGQPQKNAKKERKRVRPTKTMKEE